MGPLAPRVKRSPLPHRRSVCPCLQLGPQSQHPLVDAHGTHFFDLESFESALEVVLIGGGQGAVRHGKEDLILLGNVVSEQRDVPIPVAADLITGLWIAANLGRRFG